MPISSYKNPAKENARIFGSKVSTRLIIEGDFFYPHGDNMKYEIPGTEHRPRKPGHGFESTSTTVEIALQIHPFYAKQTQFRKRQMNVTSAYTKDYEDFRRK